MNIINKYPKQTGFISIIASIFLFMSFLQFVLVSSAIAILEPDKLGGFDYLLSVGEMFTIQYYFNIPAIIFLILGVHLIINSSKQS